ncbi:MULTISPECIES: lipopolysaccharide assembly protein LapB [unclassified Oceanispirochaeta]|uniref:tetratricopeptide repeat protein n=1 Tax=unclassified Oceanispirochaeta TaxID=2635722 RepID=UPI000E0921D6|nr:MULTISPECIES: hypothetical protein [unclassified Oceanispirochaeta]MBF9016072.1 hypothetical protein [Oceanispirochaeta sp. M2]NPD72535.1 hypothetical protein [Oceanispirochaeta sp. M1]RDG31992.1 hypothetical protein DV872_10520 [Oceanispirochaeta sp. M1]
MKIYNKTLKKAYKLLRSGQYGKVVALLEPKVPLFLENYQFYYILGIACLRNGDNGGADTYLKRAVQVNRNAVEPRLFLASLALRRKDTTEAVRLWLGILDIDSSCKEAKKGLDRIRKISDSEALDLYLNRNSFRKLLPRIRKRLSPLFLLIPLMAVIFFSGYMKRDLISGWFDSNDLPSRENLSYMFSDLKKEKLTDENPQGFIFNLTEDQILTSLKSAQTYFDAYDDNRTRKEINRVLYSNASESAKQRARILEGYLKEPDLTSFENIFDYKDVIEDPYLYNKCFIRWKGRFSNLNMSDPGMFFDFLVGYDTAEVLEGIEPAYTDFQVRLDSSLPLEVLGQIETLDRDSLRIRVVSLRNIVDP